MMECWNCEGRGTALCFTSPLRRISRGIYETTGRYVMCAYCGGSGILDRVQYFVEGGYWLKAAEQARIGGAR